MSKPNIICFLTDQHRADHLGCYGNSDIKTPNIDSIAAGGVAFTHSCVANPVCMPNRASMFTGQYPSAHGLTENGYTLSPSSVLLPELLSKAGYQTASVGKIHLAPFGMKHNAAQHPWEMYEAAEFWNSNGDLPLPYYGLQKVDLVTGHGSYAGAHYRKWLEQREPGAFDLLQFKHAAQEPSGAREAWKSSIPEELHYNTYIADRTIEHLRARNKKQPFFMWCSFPDPHHPYNPTKPWCDMYDPNSLRFKPARRENEFDDLPPYFGECYRGKRRTGGLSGDVSLTTDEHYREIHALTYGMISMVDHCIGRVLRELEAQSLMEDTIIVFLSDHGDLMGDHWLINKGPFLYRGLVTVPTIWRIPGGVGSRMCNCPVSTADLCPTLLQLAGVGIPEQVQGRSYADILRGSSGCGRDYAYIEYDESYLGDRLRQLRSRDWAITYYAANDYGLLFDLRKDPDEVHNLWNSAAHQSIKRDLLVELMRQMGRAQPPLPAKPVHA